MSGSAIVVVPARLAPNALIALDLRRCRRARQRPRPAPQSSGSRKRR
jgi:hypothetical protein